MEPITRMCVRPGGQASLVFELAGAEIRAFRAVKAPTLTVPAS